MKVRTAVLVLSCSASVMVVGLASAQQQPTVPVPAVRPTMPALEAIQNNNKNKQPTPAPPGGDPGGDSNIQPFETGIEFRRTPPGARVTFNLEDADLPDLIRLISSITGKRFILPGKARSIKATVYAPTKVTAAEAYRAFLSILELNGMTVVPAGRYLKVVESTNIERRPIPTYTGGSPTPADDRYLTRMHRLENVTAGDVAQLLERFKSAEGSITAYAPTNTLILTDLGSNIRRMLRVVEAIDVPRTGEQIWIERIHYADASEISSRLSEIFAVGSAPGAAGATPARPTPPRPAGRATPAANAGGAATVGSAGGGVSRITKILPDERTNSLIILATESAYLRILEMIRHLDVPLDGEGGIHVHYIQHGDAEDIASTLSSLVGGGGAAPRRAGGAQAQAGGGTTASTTAVFEGNIAVTAHKPTNSLVITSSLHDYAALRRVIERMDVRRRQVFIEAVVMELSVRRSKRLGISFHGGAPGFPEDGSLLLGGSNAQGSIGFPASGEALSGLALGVRGPDIPDGVLPAGLSIPSFGVVLSALSASGDANILSTPHIIAMDNEEAEISVGENVPLQTSSATGGLGSLAGLAGASGAAGAAGLASLAGLGGGGSVPRQDVGTTIRVTPHINDADEIRLEITEEISEAGAPSATGNLGVVSISKRTAKTQLVVRDQQTVVIGGLMRDAIRTEENKIPILGDIPLLGVLFRQTETRTEKTNLLLFLTPYIIRDSTDLRAIYERKMRERQDFIDRFFVFSDDHDYEPPVDYSRTRGLLGEIIAEVDELRENERLEAEAMARPPPDHVPQSPVGAAPPGLEGEEGDVIITPEGSMPFEGSAEEVTPTEAPTPTTPTEDTPQ